MDAYHATTIIAVRREGTCAMASDGQVSFGQTVMKARARKIRRLGDSNVLVGFAGSSADGLALVERFEAKLKEHRHNLQRAAVELAKDWRTDRFLRRLEAMLIVMDPSIMLLLTGNGDVLEPDEPIAAIGSGGSYALAAARALSRHTTLSALDIARESLLVASEICVYTNHEIVLEELTG